jgi:release factor glutamine methyltransferase
VGYTQDDAVRALFAAQPELEVGPSVKDGGGRWRVVTARKRK